MGLWQNLLAFYGIVIPRSFEYLKTLSDTLNDLQDGDPAQYGQVDLMRHHEDGSYSMDLLTWIYAPSVKDIFSASGPDSKFDINDIEQGYVSLQQLKLDKTIDNYDCLVPTEAEKNMLTTILREIKQSNHNFTDQELNDLEIAPFAMQTSTCTLEEIQTSYMRHLPLVDKPHVNKYVIDEYGYAVFDDNDNLMLVGAEDEKHEKFQHDTSS